jgi:DnaJ-class molecular chaperone
MSDSHDRKRGSVNPTRKAAAAAEGGDGEGDLTAEESRSPQPCMPCHGTGKVISNLAGRTRKVTCPWCRGGGIRLTGVDAQEFQQEQQTPLNRR